MIGLLLGLSLQLAQDQSVDAPAHRFDVISIKPAAPGTTFQLRPGPNQFTATNVSVRVLIQGAYRVDDYQVSGAPGWATSEKFDVAGTTERQVGRDEMRAMLRSLLAERFHLKAREEIRESTVFSLTVAKKGAKVVEVTSEAEKRVLLNQAGSVTGHPATMSDLASALSGELDRTCTDDTGLKGRYNFHLEYAPGSADGASLEGSLPTLFTALEEQLGLKLQSKKGKDRFLVIEHIERPDPN